MEKMNGLSLLLLLFLFNNAYVFGHSPAALEIPSNEEIDYEIVMKAWNNISVTWCMDADIPEQVIDGAYECFRQNRGELEHTLQIKCEKKIFPSKMTKNDIRRAMCRLEPRILAKFEECYAQGGENTTAEIEEERHLLDADRHQKRVKEFHQFESLVVCMRKAFGWDDGTPLIPPLEPNMWPSYTISETYYEEEESIDFDDYP